MSKTNFQDPASSEVRSTHISGLQEAVNKLEESLGITSTAETGIPLTEVFISNDDRFRIYQAPAGKRNWLLSPTPIIKKNGVAIVEGFEIDYGGGAIITSVSALETDVFTADVSYTVKFVTDIIAQLADKVDKISGKGLSTEDYTTEEMTKLSGIENSANNYIHPSTHSAEIITVSDDGEYFTSTNSEDVLQEIGAELEGIETNKISTSQKGVANGVATLDENIKIPLTELPSDYFMSTTLSWGQTTKTVSFTRRDTSGYTDVKTITIPIPPTTHQVLLGVGDYLSHEINRGFNYILTGTRTPSPINKGLGATTNLSGASLKIVDITSSFGVGNIYIVDIYISGSYLYIKAINDTTSFDYPDKQQLFTYLCRG